jgi:peptidyl-prolyl cis-trans isomerase B (cyclophilin B)
MRSIAASVVLAVVVAAWASAAQPAKPKDQTPAAGRLAVIETARGTIKIVLYEKDAPITTKNFIELANRKFYDGLTFHRVEEWVVQGGDPKGDGTGGSDKTIKLETKPGLGFEKPYTVGMARTPDPDSATSQFFITKQPAAWLSGQYAVFGRVLEGQQVVDKLQKGDVMKTVRIVARPTPKKPAPRKAEKAKR